jgi:predicted phosphodiesterase
VTASIRIAVVSDIHASELDGDDSYVASQPNDLQRGTEPLRDLLRYVRTHEIKADYLMCPGDIANKADAIGLAHGWRQLHLLARELGAALIAAPGNHDIITHAESADSRAHLKQLLPSFPSGNIDADELFWRDGWLLHEEPDHRILVIDSTSEFPRYPITGTSDPSIWAPYSEAIERGSFPTHLAPQLDDLFDALAPKINIALVHHHPQEHQLKRHLKDGYGPMRDGDSLIDLLSRHPEMGRWLVIHGHKHIPQLSAATGTTSNGPLMLCAASLGAKLWAPVNTVARNQFHLLTVSNQEPDIIGAVRGIVDSYHWGFGEGWQRSERRGAGLPASSGFGHGGDFRETVQRVRLSIEDTGAQYISYSDILASTPELPYMPPADFDLVEAELDRLGYEFARGRDDRIMQLFRRAD